MNESCYSPVRTIRVAIDVREFIGALDKLDFDGPIRAEPFNQSLNAMENDEAVKFTADAMKKALSE